MRLMAVRMHDMFACLLPMGRCPAGSLFFHLLTGWLVALAVRTPLGICSTDPCGGGENTSRMVPPTPRAWSPLHHAHGMYPTLRVVCASPCAWPADGLLRGVQRTVRVVNSSYSARPAAGGAESDEITSRWLTGRGAARVALPFRNPGRPLSALCRGGGGMRSNKWRILFGLKEK